MPSYTHQIQVLLSPAYKAKSKVILFVFNSSLRATSMRFWCWLAGIACLFTLGCRADKNTTDNSNSAPPTTITSPTDALRLVTHRYLVQDQTYHTSYAEQAQKPVQVYRYPSEQIVTLAEQQQLSGDVVIVDDLYHAHQLKKAGVLSPYNAGTFGDYVPDRFVDREGFWAAWSRWTMSFVFRDDVASREAMRNYAVVLNPDYRGRIAIAHPDSSGLTAMVAGMLAAYGPQPATLYLQSLQTNLVQTPSGNDLDALQLVINGQADVAFINGSEYLRYKNSGNPDAFKSTESLRMEIPVDAQGNNYYNASLIGILKDTPIRQYGITFIEFMTLEQTQNDLTAAGMEYPVHVFSEMSDFLSEPFNVPQGNVTLEDMENNLEEARAIIRQVFGM